MAFNPDNYNVVDYTGLSAASSPALSWLLAIQDPSTNIISQLPASSLALLLNGTVSLPNGVINGLVFSVNNANTPKIGTVSVGNWRINNTPYNLPTEFNFNINASGGSNRTDAILADQTSVYYQPNYTTLPANTIVVATFVVPTGGGNITSITQTSDLVTAYMNALNTGNFNISGNFQINGVNVSTRVGLTLTFAGVSVVNGSIDLSAKTGMPVAGTIPFGLLVFADDVDYTNSSSYTPSTRTVFGGFTGTESLITIKIIF